MEITTDGRSPDRPRQLDDLRLQPTATDPRPTFFWSADAPRYGNMSAVTEFPKLMWHGETGEEITAYDEQEQRRRMVQGYVLSAPAAAAAVAPMDAIRAELAALSPEDRALVIEAQRQQRLQALQAKMASLDSTALDSLLGDADVQRYNQDEGAGRFPEPRRGPGRPPKVA